MESNGRECWRVMGGRVGGLWEGGLEGDGRRRFEDNGSGGWRIMGGRVGG